MPVEMLKHNMYSPDVACRGACGVHVVLKKSVKGCYRQVTRSCDLVLGGQSRLVSKAPWTKEPPPPMYRRDSPPPPLPKLASAELSSGDGGNTWAHA